MTKPIKTPPHFLRENCLLLLLHILFGDHFMFFPLSSCFSLLLAGLFTLVFARWVSGIFPKYWVPFRHHFPTSLTAAMGTVFALTHTEGQRPTAPPPGNSDAQWPRAERRSCKQNNLNAAGGSAEQDGSRLPLPPCHPCSSVSLWSSGTMQVLSSKNSLK